ncbi:hypothetical protein [Pandoraea terrae]|uniref:hypothetical protein n=1 Tax=Pandoraea terrae TaxID=1537710 RepID=UPI00124267CD|nr:hypothetical protein [Pandoraea terrae]
MFDTKLGKFRSNCGKKRKMQRAFPSMSRGRAASRADNLKQANFQISDNRFQDCDIPVEPY